MSEGELISNGIKTGDNLLLEFNSGVLVKGNLEKITRKQGMNLIFSFQNCTVSYQDNVLFRPEWGIYDMAVGETIVSAFAGPADPDSFGLKYPAPREKTHHIQYTAEMLRLQELYSQVRSIREYGVRISELEGIWQILKVQFPDEWLLPLEIAELLSSQNENNLFAEEVSAFLKAYSCRSEEAKILIEAGIQLITNP
jgi:phenylalanine-4-hydroxylase